MCLVSSEPPWHDMGMLLVPERTVDSLLAIELLTALPTSIIWSPQAVAVKNSPGQAGTPDHYLRTASRRYVFECKTLHAPKRQSTTGWRVKVPFGQLDRYVRNGLGGILYLLPAKPAQVHSPWVRICNSHGVAGAACAACRNPAAQSGPVYERRWAGLHSPVKQAPAYAQFQPWFNHWAWCVTADDLHAYLLSMRSRSSLPAVISIDASDASLQSIPGADRLCHFLSWAAPAAPPPASDVEGADETQSDEHDDGAESESGSGERGADEGVYSGVRDHRSEYKGFESWSISVETISHWSTDRAARLVLSEAQNLSGVAL